MGQFIGIEAGGTKFVCAYGNSPDTLSERTVIPTETPEITMKAVGDFIRRAQKKTDILAIGVGTFGPLDPDPHSKTYGYITTTPKKHWANYDFAGYLHREFELPVGFDTDVNAAALGEYRWGAAQGLSDFIYITVGTGIGAGAMVNHQLLHGAMHSEMGHILIPQDASVDAFEGVCPFHKNCLEGLASGPSMNARWGVESALDIPESHKAWDIEADYLAKACSTYTMCLSPKRIIMGGGVMRQTHLLAKIRPKILDCLAGYIKNETVIDGIDNYVMLPGLGEDSGILGAIALAQHAFSHRYANDEVVYGD
jgi:fructokinase